MSLDGTPEIGHLCFRLRVHLLGAPNGAPEHVACPQGRSQNRDNERGGYHQMQPDRNRLEHATPGRSTQQKMSNQCDAYQLDNDSTTSHADCTDPPRNESICRDSHSRTPQHRGDYRRPRDDVGDLCSGVHGIRLNESGLIRSGKRHESRPHPPLSGRSRFVYDGANRRSRGDVWSLPQHAPLIGIGPRLFNTVEPFRAVVEQQSLATELARCRAEGVLTKLPADSKVFV